MPSSGTISSIEVVWRREATKEAVKGSLRREKKTRGVLSLTMKRRV